MLAPLLLAASPVTAQVELPQQMMSGSPIVSPSVLATWYTSRDSEAARLDLIVLWRGQVGWHRAGVAVTGTDGFCPETGERCPGLAHTRYQVGPIELEVTIDRLQQIARVLEEEIDLRETNAVLVDRIDRIDRVDGSPTVVGRLWLPMTLSSLRMDADSLVRGTDRLNDFAR